MAEARLRAVLFDAVGHPDPPARAGRRDLCALRRRARRARSRRAASRRPSPAAARRRPPMVFPGEPAGARPRPSSAPGGGASSTTPSAPPTAPRCPGDFDALFAALCAHYAGRRGLGARAGCERGAPRAAAPRPRDRHRLELRPAPARACSRGLGVHHLFHAIVLPAEIGAAKPDRAIFDAALKRLGLAGEQVGLRRRPRGRGRRRPPGRRASARSTSGALLPSPSCRAALGARRPRATETP